MARYIGPKTKIARKFGDPIFGPDKYLQKRIIPLDNMVFPREEVRNLSMQFSFQRSKKLSTPMEF